MCLWLRFLGWTIVSPVQFTDERGSAINITIGSPELAKSMFLDSLRKKTLQLQQQRHAERNGTALLIPWAQPFRTIIRSKTIIKLEQSWVVRVWGAEV